MGVEAKWMQRYSKSTKYSYQFCTFPIYSRHESVRELNASPITGKLLSVIKSLELQGVNPYTGGMDLLQKAK